MDVTFDRDIMQKGLGRRYQPGLCIDLGETLSS